jgi:integrase
MTGLDRFWLYGLALQTGLRASELASLIPASFNLTADQPNVRLKAAYAKNRKEAIQPLPAEIVESLTVYLASKPTDKPIWPGSWYLRAYRMIALDLAEAGIERETEAGRWISTLPGIATLPCW